MNKNSLVLFLKPYRKKILLTILIYLIFPTPVKSTLYSISGGSKEYIYILPFGGLVIVAGILLDVLLLFSGKISPPVYMTFDFMINYLVFLPLVCYFLSCLIIGVFNMIVTRFNSSGQKKSC